MNLETNTQSQPAPAEWHPANDPTMQLDPQLSALYGTDIYNPRPLPAGLGELAEDPDVVKAYARIYDSPDTAEQVNAHFDREKQSKFKKIVGVAKSVGHSAMAGVANTYLAVSKFPAKFSEELALGSVQRAEYSAKPARQKRANDGLRRATAYRRVAESNPGPLSQKASQTVERNHRRQVKAARQPYDKHAAYRQDVAMRRLRQDLVALDPNKPWVN